MESEATTNKQIQIIAKVFSFPVDSIIVKIAL